MASSLSDDESYGLYGSEATTSGATQSIVSSYGGTDSSTEVAGSGVKQAAAQSVREE